MHPTKYLSSVQFSSVAQSCPTLCDPMNHSTPGLLPITISQSSLRLTSFESVMPSSRVNKVVDEFFQTSLDPLNWLCSSRSLMAQTVKNLLTHGQRGFNPWAWQIPWRRQWLPTPVFLPEEFLGQRSLASYSPRGCKESDKMERLTVSLVIMLRVTIQDF